MLPFTSQTAFWEAFNGGFEPLLEGEQLGTFILVLSNASFDPELHQQLSGPIHHTFKALYQRYESQLLRGEVPPESDEDLLVFFKIATVGIERISQSQTRSLSLWEVQFNPLRAFRPRRISAAVSSGLSLPFNPDGFHFNRPFMDKEIFWSGSLMGRTVDLYYNKYPFTQGHGLLVPDRQLELPQLLTESCHHYLCEVAHTLGESLPGSGFGYNSYGAYASVNHLHFQMFLRDSPFPIEHLGWNHNGGASPYPAHCIRITEPHQSWHKIKQLHRQYIPYNLLYIGKQCYILPRLRQGQVDPAEWSSGFSWHEMAGGILTSSLKAFESLREDQITTELQQAGIEAN